MPPAAEPRGLPDGGTSHAVAAKGITSMLRPKATIGPDIIDIRGAALDTINLRDDILSLFRPESGPRQLPTLLLYDEKGLQLFEKVCSVFPVMLARPLLVVTDSLQITYLREYYLTNDEIRVLETSAVAIAREIPDGSMVIELGSGYILSS